jgi:YVTN family beta-propeller protein
MGGEVERMRALVTAVCLMVIVAACGRAPNATLVSGADYKLYEATSQGNDVAVIDSRSHTTERTLPLGTPSADWKHLYSVSGAMLTDTDPATGATLRQLRLQDDYRLPEATLSGVPGGLSQNGHWLVVESFDMAGNIPSTTHFLVIDTTYSVSPRPIELHGNFNFDAVSNDGQRLYLIEFVSTTIYRVRMYDVLQGLMDPTIVFDKSDGSQAMAGLRLGGVASPDGSMLYSIYIREKQGPFIHALSLDAPVAFCIDLPGAGYGSDGGGDAFHWSLALSPDGTHLYAANAATGTVTVINTTTNLSPPTVIRTVHINMSGAASGALVQNVQAKEFGANGAVLSPDGQTLVTIGMKGINWIDTATLKLRSRALLDWTVWSLALSTDGTTLYALSDSGKVAELSMTGPNLSATFDPGAGQPLALIRVEAATP